MIFAASVLVGVGVSAPVVERTLIDRNLMKKACVWVGSMRVRNLGILAGLCPDLTGHSSSLNLYGWLTCKRRYS